MCILYYIHPTESVEATEGASADTALVMMAGSAKTAAAPWKLLFVWQTTRCCVTLEGFANAENVYVTHHIQARPVRTALFVRAHGTSAKKKW